MCCKLPHRPAGFTDTRFCRARNRSASTEVGLWVFQPADILIPCCRITDIHRLQNMAFMNLSDEQAAPALIATPGRPAMTSVSALRSPIARQRCSASFCTGTEHPDIAPKFNVRPTRHAMNR